MKLTDKRIHMIGIGGIGMSALASILSDMGNKVSGSDKEESEILKNLRKKGVEASIGHGAPFEGEKDLVVYSSAIRDSNPEILEAKKKNIRIIHRIELLKMIMEEYGRVIGVTGTHGKTTITAMSALLAEKAGFDPTVLIGGESVHFESNAKFGTGGTLVSEVDESDGKFVILNRVTHVIMPNLEKEHMEHYSDEEDLRAAVGRFLSAQPENGVFFHRAEDPNLRKLSPCFRGRIRTFGFSDEADVRASGVDIKPFKIDFDCFNRGTKLGRFTLNMAGVHNVANAAAVISLGIELGIDIKIIMDTLASYKSVKRRFEVIGDVKGARVVEDYAHHPTEIKATISAAYSLRPRRIISVFQPHRYTRTRSFYKDFSSAFLGSDEVILTDVYSASEDRIEGADAKSIYDEMVKEKTVPVSFLKKEKIPEYLCANVKDGDLVLIMGAGDIGKVGHEFVARLKNEK
ncbi:MAG: UDP-N-acetylmuramate--L-alanine ligase [Candidatus Omnitrophica bacterium]|nr:UDP-N-acetylmuramate--L-alanine ligase [Candidatus Omnitrophota bacterium]